MCYNVLLVSVWHELCTGKLPLFCCYSPRLILPAAPRVPGPAPPFGRSRVLAIEIAAHSRIINAIDLHPTSMQVRRRHGEEKTGQRVTWEGILYGKAM